MLKQFTVLHTPPGSIDVPNTNGLSYITLHTPEAPEAGPSTLVTYPPLRSYAIAPLPFLDGQSTGLTLSASGVDLPLPGTKTGLKVRPERTITGFVRTPEGDAITVGREEGDREIWSRNAEGQLYLLASFSSGEDHDAVCLFDEGKSLLH